MIKFTLHNEKAKLIGVGLSHKNLTKLKDGAPITIDLSELGFTGNWELFIFSGHTVLSMMCELETKIGPQTVIKSFKDRN